MKTLLISLLLLPCSAFAAPSVMVSHTLARISVSNLECVIRVGSKEPVSKRTFVQLKDLSLFPEKQGVLRLEHTVAGANGCDLKKLDKIVLAAYRAFGFIHHAPVEVIQTTSESQTRQFGECSALFTETVNVDIGGGIILTSEEGGFIKMTDCK
jgi:hypothetical protein